MPNPAKSKGSSGEREVAELFMMWGRAVGVHLDISRNLEQTRGGGHDLIGLEKYQMAVEVKRVETPNMTAFWAQAVRQAERVGYTPVLAHRQNRRPWCFRVRAWIFPCNELLDIDMDMAMFKLWFQARIQYATAHRPVESCQPVVVGQAHTVSA